MKLTSPRIRILTDPEEDSKLARAFSTYIPINFDVDQVINEDNSENDDEAAFKPKYNNKILDSCIDKTDVYEEIISYKMLSNICEPIKEEFVEDEEEKKSNRNRSHNMFYIPMCDEFDLKQGLLKMSYTKSIKSKCEEEIKEEDAQKSSDSSF